MSLDPHSFRQLLTLEGERREELPVNQAQGVEFGVHLMVCSLPVRARDDGSPGAQTTVVFSTYQSIDAVSQAQKAGLPEFDLIICDEAHRTTGVTLSGEAELAQVADAIGPLGLLLGGAQDR
jgi:hypothetical protein